MPLWSTEHGRLTVEAASSQSKGVLATLLARCLVNPSGVVDGCGDWLGGLHLDRLLGGHVERQKGSLRWLYGRENGATLNHRAA
jgi:hypothetical protein